MQTRLTEADLLSASADTLLEYFKTLDAPTIEEMHGEYTAQLLAQPDWLADKIGALVLHNPFRRWQSKAFRPINETTGRGYNGFLQGHTHVQHYPMLTMLAASRYDHRPVYQLIYRHFHSTCGSINMVDEIRKVGPHLYLGIGTYGFTEKQRRIAYPFLLKGPVHAYRKDIGRERKGFKISSRENPSFSAV